MSLSIRPLTPDDAEAYGQLRLAGLKADARAFASDYAAEAKLTVTDHRKTLDANRMVGAFDGDTLVGSVGYFVPRHASMAHRGHVWGMIVAKSHRGQGIGRSVLSALVEDAKAQNLRQLHLGVGAYNVAAIHLYKRLGFCTYGTEPRALHIGDEDIDEHLMVLFLDKEDR
ncbi:GNAT family N-acetyltransferase [Pelagibacterium luteolum]|uniref:Ribosomal protein S18 acetylase RimI n=1 Tax=Pelagibacterium luteolum TaxID=440168 RepID=A0A1G7SI75_9HYPH|nr:GNAT family N-acetyltransferase [Pelagibacterium luteolum]SDG22766.1 Ribosomal protein S18 acetylase RimI [Pelagibacterium luteolum]